MRNMSFMLTTQAARNQTKTVTRRFESWMKLQRGALVQQVVKGMGLKKGEKIEKIHVIQILSNTPEPLRRLTDDPAYGRAEVIKEGFPEMTPEQFVEMFCKSHKGCTPESLVNRIEFHYIPTGMDLKFAAYWLGMK